MSIHIGPDSDPKAAAEAHTASIAASTYRETSIEQYLSSLGGSDGLTVTCVANKQTACIEQDTTETAPTIQIPARDFSQSTTDFPQKVANRLMQYGLALHEYGHDQYTDGPYLTEKFDRLQFQVPEKRSYYWSLVNMIEDHRIETAVILDEGEWAQQRLDFVHQNLTVGEIDAIKNPHNITWTSALKSASCHFGKAREQSFILPVLMDDANQRLQWRSQSDKQLYHWVLPELRLVLNTAASEPDAKAAANLEFEFVQQLDEFIATLTPQSEDEAQEQSVAGSGDDKRNDMGSQKQPAETLSETGQADEDRAETGGEKETKIDSQEHTEQSSEGGTEQTADSDTQTQLKDSSGATEDEAHRSETEAHAATDQSEQKHGSESFSTEGDEQGKQDSAVGDSSLAGEQSEGSTSAGKKSKSESEDSQYQTPDSPSKGLLQHEARQVGAEEQKIEQDKQMLIAEIQRAKDAIESGRKDMRGFEVITPGGEPSDQETWKQIKGEAGRLKSLFRQSLQRTQQTNEQRGTRVGRFDSKLSYRLATGNLSVNKRCSGGDQRQYSVVVVLDRSGSMHNKIQAAEIAAGGFIKSLEEIGVTVALIDLYKDTARMVKSFQTTTEQAQSEIASSKVGGTTPLTDALTLSKQQVEQGNHTPFIIIVSDGAPNNEDAYLETLSSISFPVVGINIASDESISEDFNACYDVCQSSPPEDLSKTLSEIATQMIF